ncbi:MAG: hypothetical protein ACREO4_15010 [Lysobacter sp.]
MNNNRTLMIGALGLMLAACGGQGPEEDLAAPMESTAVEPAARVAPAAPRPADDSAQPVVLAGDGVTVGSALGPDGAVSAGKSAYAADDVIHASVPVAGRPAGAEVTVYWFAENGTSVKQESKPVVSGTQFVNFTLSAADGMVPGRYTAQVDIDDEPVGMADFVVR